MPLTSKGEKILKSMEKTYGAKKAKQVLYASKNAGKVSGIDALVDSITKLAARVDACTRRMDKRVRAGRLDSKEFVETEHPRDEGGKFSEGGGGSGGEAGGEEDTRPIHEKLGMTQAEYVEWTNKFREEEGKGSPSDNDPADLQDQETLMDEIASAGDLSDVHDEFSNLSGSISTLREHVEELIDPETGDEQEYEDPEDQKKWEAQRDEYIAGVKEASQKARDKIATARQKLNGYERSIADMLGEKYPIRPEGC